MPKDPHYWSDITDDPGFKKLDPQTQAEVASLVFRRNVATDPAYKKLDPAERTEVRNLMFSKILPELKMEGFKPDLGLLQPLAEKIKEHGREGIETLVRALARETEPPGPQRNLPIWNLGEAALGGAGVGIAPLTGLSEVLGETGMEGVQALGASPQVAGGVGSLVDLFTQFYGPSALLRGGRGAISALRRRPGLAPAPEAARPFTPTAPIEEQLPLFPHAATQEPLALPETYTTQRGWWNRERFPGFAKGKVTDRAVPTEAPPTPVFKGPKRAFGGKFYREPIQEPLPLVGGAEQLPLGIVYKPPRIKPLGPGGPDIPASMRSPVLEPPGASQGQPGKAVFNASTWELDDLPTSVVISSEAWRNDVGWLKMLTQGADEVLKGTGLPEALRARQRMFHRALPQTINRLRAALEGSTVRPGTDSMARLTSAMDIEKRMLPRDVPPLTPADLTPEEVAVGQKLRAILDDIFDRAKDVGIVTEEQRIGTKGQLEGYVTVMNKILDGENPIASEYLAEILSWLPRKMRVRFAKSRIGKAPGYEGYDLADLLQVYVPVMERAIAFKPVMDEMSRVAKVMTDFRAAKAAGFYQGTDTKALSGFKELHNKANFIRRIQDNILGKESQFYKFLSRAAQDSTERLVRVIEGVNKVLPGKIKVPFSGRLAEHLRDVMVHRPVSRIAIGMQMAFYRGVLGLNLAVPVTNIPQVINTMIDFGVGQTLRGAKDFLLKADVRTLFHRYGIQERFVTQEVFPEATQRVMQTGLLSREMIPVPKALTPITKSGKISIDDILFSPLATMEYLLRGVTFHTAVGYRLRQLGLKSVKEAFEAGVLDDVVADGIQGVADTQFFYDIAARNPYWQSPIGRMVTMLGTYPAKQAMRTVNIWKEARVGSTLKGAVKAIGDLSPAEFAEALRTGDKTRLLRTLYLLPGAFLTGHLAGVDWAKMADVATLGLASAAGSRIFNPLKSSPAMQAALAIPEGVKGLVDYLIAIDAQDQIRARESFRNMIRAVATMVPAGQAARKTVNLAQGGGQFKYARTAMENAGLYTGLTPQSVEDRRKRSPQYRAAERRLGRLGNKSYLGIPLLPTPREGF